MGRLAGTIGVLVLMTALLAGCGGSASAKALHVADVTQQSTYSKQTLLVNNCGAKGPAVRVAQRSVTYGVKLGAGVGFSQAVAEETLTTEYSSYQNDTESIELDAPPNTNMQFVLGWTVKTFLGQILHGNDSNGANFHYDVPIGLVIVSSRDLGCATPGAEVIQTVTVVPTSGTGNEPPNVVTTAPTGSSQMAPTAELSTKCVSKPATGVGGVVPLIEGDTLPKGCAVIVREIDWSTHDAMVWYTQSLNSELTFGQEGAWVVEGWTSPTGLPWGWMKTDACKEVASIERGSLGSTGWTVEFQHGKDTCP